MRVTFRRVRESVGQLPVMAMLLASCAGVPEIVEFRPDLPDCSENQQVFLPVQQGFDAFEEQSRDALECFTSSVVGEQPAELEFILLGVEGEEYRSILQVFDDGTVDFFQENDWGWEIYEGCSDFSLPEPGIPLVSACDSTQVDGPG